MENGFTAGLCLLITSKILPPPPQSSTQTVHYGHKSTGSYWSCVLETALDVDGQVAVILAPSIIHSVIWVSHSVSLSAWQVRMRLALPPCSFQGLSWVGRGGMVKALLLFWKIYYLKLKGVKEDICLSIQVICSTWITWHKLRSPTSDVLVTGTPRC